MMHEGYILNPETEFVRDIKKKIKSNSGYCISKRDKVKDNKCPCRDFKEGKGCDCGLYMKAPEWMRT